MIIREGLLTLNQIYTTYFKDLLWIYI